jgi:hypothetical protein
VVNRKWSERPAWFLAAKSGNVKVFKELWVCAKEEGDPAEMKSKLLQLLLAKDYDGYTAWHRAVEEGRLEALKTLWNWAKEAELNTGELLLAKNERGETSFHMAAQQNHVEILHKLWAWVEETQSKTNELKRTLLLAKDKNGCTAWHTAAIFGHLKILDALLSLAKEAELNPYELLLALNEEEEIAFNTAELRIYQEILQKIWDWAEEEHLSGNEIEKPLLLTKENDGKSRGTNQQGLAV